MSACNHTWNISLGMEKCECGKWRAMGQPKVIKKEDREQQPIVHGANRATMDSDDPHVVLQDIKRTLTGLLNRIDRALIT